MVKHEMKMDESLFELMYELVDIEEVVIDNIIQGICQLTSTFSFPNLLKKT